MVKRNSMCNRGLILAGAHLYLSAGALGTIYHVKAIAPAGGDGLTWANAFQNVQSALALADAGDEVWVATGVYTPPNGSSFTPVPGVVLLGGFQGTENTSSLRDVDLHATTLRGSDRTVLFLNFPSNTVPETVVDGFTITAGKGGTASGTIVQGGGVTVRNAPLRLSRCKIINNINLQPYVFSSDEMGFGSGGYPGAHGGGIKIFSAVVVMHNVHFVGNASSNGQGAGCSGGFPELQDAGSGAAIAAANSIIEMSSCAFSENRPGTGGWQQCTVKQRSTPPGVGGSMLLVSSTLIAKSCTFTASETNGFGNTAIFATGSNAINLEKCSFFGRGRIVGGTPIITQGPVGAFDCVFTGCRSSNGYVIDGAATFPQSGSAVKAGAGSSFRNCTFVDNRIGIFAPGTPLPTVDPALGCLDAPGAIVKNCIFSNNVGFGYTTISNHVGKVGTVTSSCIDTLDEFPPATILFTDPRFVDPDGPNGIPGDADDDYRLSPGSPCIDAGNNAAYPITSSTTDLLGNPRFLDDAYTVDTGLGAAPLIDIGAIEFVQTLPVCVADVDNGQGEGQRDGAVTVDDLIFYLAYFNIGAHQTDVDDGSGTGTPDGAVTIDDLLYYLIRFNAGC